MNERSSLPWLGEFTSKRMDETRFLDLAIQIGRPYTYVHEGDCEHEIIFTQVRMTNENDPPSGAYPYLVYLRPMPRTKCTICGQNFANYVTLDDHKAPESPCYFCRLCFVSLHCDENGKVMDENLNFRLHESDHWI
jgi:hypothetical protein